MSHRLGAVLASGIVVALLIACGSSGDSGFGDSTGDDGGDEGILGSSSGSSGPGFGDSGNDTGSGDDSGLNECASDTQEAHLSPLSLMLMQDTSGSMWSYVSGTTSKWDAIKAALGTFMTDPASSGIGLGVQFFPIFGNGVPNSCTATADCGAAGGICNRGFCSKNGAQCSVDADCGAKGGTCGAALRCHDEQEFQCAGPTDLTCLLLGIGACDRPLVRGSCANETLSCTVADYQAPAVAIAPLPGVGTAINAALGVRIPNGLTPTYGALQGAINAAKTYATAHTGEVVAVVLSTDGIPNSGPNPQPAGCNDAIAAIQGVAAAGVAGTPSIKTFVIGTLAPADVAAGAPATLNAIAASGGTGTATILGTSATTEADFIAALGKIRGASLPCEFKLPVPEAGTPDYKKVNVVYTNSATKKQTVIGYVGDASKCDATKGGWYYDADPDKGGTPTKVILCPASCSVIQGDPQGKVGVVQGCATQVQGPPH
jgi:hypothetical protein